MTNRDLETHHKIEDELRRKLSCAEAELIRQTGCTADDVAGIYRLPIPKPVVNARMGESHRLRFEAEDENARLRAQVAELVKAGQDALNVVWVENLVAKEEGNIRYEATTKAVYDKLQAAIAAAEGGAE